jgi:hypothetical protein
MKKYTEMENGYIVMDNDGIISTIPNDLSNSDYQEYLNPSKANMIEAVDE